MARYYLPQGVAVAMTKGQFCYCTGCTMTNLRKILADNYEKWARLGYHKYDKMLMPAMVRELLAVTGLRIDQEYFIQYRLNHRRQTQPETTDTEA